MLTWSANCGIVEVKRVAAFTVKDTKPYVSAVKDTKPYVSVVKDTKPYVSVVTKTIRFFKTRFSKNN